jgi:hypothetical protein
LAATRDPVFAELLHDPSAMHGATLNFGVWQAPLSWAEAEPFGLNLSDRM